MEQSLQCVDASQRDCHEKLGVMEDLESCSAQLRVFGGRGDVDWSCRDDKDDELSDIDTHSAADIASECLSLLESLSITTDARVDEAVSTPRNSSVSPDTALLREINDLGSELQALMTALCPPPSEHGSSASHSDDDGNDESLSICTSPKMVALTKRLERRPSTQRMLVHTALRRHRPFPLGLKSPSPSITKKGGNESTSVKSATRVLLNDTAFWHQYQSKSFQHHLARQTQARANQQQAKEKESKAIEYRYRRVPKPCYPLEKNKQHDVEPVAEHVKSVRVSGVSSRTKRTYAQRLNGTHGIENQDGLLCGVYLHGKRRSRGMLYLTCTSLAQLKTRIAQKFSLGQPVVNLYREQIATDTNGTRERKYLHRVTRFSELRGGDLLCATADGYDDMAILCAWMKKRQQMIHNYKSPQKTATAPKINPLPQPPQPMKKTQPMGSLAYKPPPPVQVKLWDENGRLVSICQRLPLAQ